MSRRHPDVDVEVSSTNRGEESFRLKTFDEAASKAILIAIATGGSVLDVVVHSRAGAKFVGGDDGAASYDEDPEASVFERFQIKVNAQGIVGGIRAPRPQDEAVGPSADTLFVTLPSDPRRIQAIASFVQKASDGPDEFSRLTPPARISDRGVRGSITADQLRGGNTLRLWWD
jgi:hypothetical protein